MGATPTAPKPRRRSPAQPRRAATAAAPRPQIAPDERIGVAHLTAEYWPFARTGGLGEAVSGPATCQAAAGLPTAVILPPYPIVSRTTPALGRAGSAPPVPPRGAHPPAPARPPPPPPRRGPPGPFPAGGGGGVGSSRRAVQRRRVRVVRPDECAQRRDGALRRRGDRQPLPCGRAAHG